MARLAEALTVGPEAGRQARLASQAMAVARKVGDRHTLARVIGVTLFATWAPDTLQERLAGVAEGLSLADEFGDQRLVLSALNAMVAMYLEIGDFRGAKQAFANLARRSEAVRDRFARWV